MTTRPNLAPDLEPSPEAVKAARERLRHRGVSATEDAVLDALRTVLLIESARLDRRAREAAVACLLGIQDATREALAVLAQGSHGATVRMPGAQPGPSIAAVRPAVQPVPAPAPAPLSPRRDQPANLADVVRQRLGEELPPEDQGARPFAPPTPTPARPAAEPRRPVFKRPRGR